MPPVRFAFPERRARPAGPKAKRGQPLALVVHQKLEIVQPPAAGLEPSKQVLPPGLLLVAVAKVDVVVLQRARVRRRQLLDAENEGRQRRVHLPVAARGHLAADGLIVGVGKAARRHALDNDVDAARDENRRVLRRQRRATLKRLRLLAQPDNRLAARRVRLAHKHGKGPVPDRVVAPLAKLEQMRNNLLAVRAARLARKQRRQVVNRNQVDRLVHAGHVVNQAQRRRLKRRALCGLCSIFFHSHMILAIPLSILSSILLVSLNKHIFAAFPFPATLSAAHFACTLALASARAAPNTPALPLAHRVLYAALNVTSVLSLNAAIRT